jgi:DNA-binding PadR family transcriptional regulator
LVAERHGLALLSLLGDEPKHGYQLMQDLEAKSCGSTVLALSTRRFSSWRTRGLVISKQSEGRQVYRLSGAGKAERKGSAETAQKIWERAQSWGRMGAVDGALRSHGGATGFAWYESCYASCHSRRGQPREKLRRSGIFSSAPRKTSKIWVKNREATRGRLRREAYPHRNPLSR